MATTLSRSERIIRGALSIGKVNGSDDFVMTRDVKRHIELGRPSAELATFIAHRTAYCNQILDFAESQLPFVESDRAALYQADIAMTRQMIMDKLSQLSQA